MTKNNFISKEVQLGANCSIADYATIYEDVVVGDNVVIGPNVVVYPGTRIGNNCKIFPGAVIGGDPQDLKYKGKKTYVDIGDHTVIRECVTINRGTSDYQATKIGSHCLIMAYVHVAHDCIIKNRCILANSVRLAGHVKIDDWAILQGNVGVQQFVRVGVHSFIAGNVALRKNVPPYIKVAREPASYIGINRVGLRRRGFNENDIEEIDDIYTLLFVQNRNVAVATEKINEKYHSSDYKDQIIDFIRNSSDGIIRGYSTKEN